MTDTTFCLFFHNVTPSFFTIMSHFLPGVVSNYTSFEKNQSTGARALSRAAYFGLRSVYHSFYDVKHMDDEKKIYFEKMLQGSE